MCAALGAKYGKWPHEVLLCRNDPPGQFEMDLLFFDLQAFNIHEEAVEAAHEEAMRKAKRR